MRPVEFFVPVRTVSEANAHEHWRVRHKRAKAQRTVARMVAEGSCSEQYRIAVRIGMPAVVHMTRVGARKLDSDNLQGALKHVRDGIADWLGIDDGRDDLVRWEYAQQTGQPVGVHVVVRKGGE